MPTSNLAFENWFETTLSSGITASSTTIPLNSLPAGTEGYLVIDPDIPASREIIFFDSKTASEVVCPSVGAGRGQDGTTAGSHNSGATVRMNIVAAHLEALQSTESLEFGGAWETDWTPTYAASGSMTYTSVTTVQAEYIRIGKTIIAKIRASGTTGGSASSSIYFTLPSTAASAYANCYGSLGDSGTAIAFGGLQSSTQAYVRNYNSANWGLGAGRVIDVTIIYQEV